MLKQKTAKIIARNQPIKLSAEDVIVQELELPICASCESTATHCVAIDVRNAGATYQLEQLCFKCANKLADRVRSALQQERG